jgi:radical SAM superfamily enzyme YgiQ (UPF0313 family)
MKRRIDLLITHVPKASSYYPPYGEYMTTNLLPMGTWALAELAATHGYQTEIGHLGLQWITQGVFSPLGYLKGRSVMAVAIPLHWHQQSYDVMQAADEIKRERPEVFILLGGYTASLFHTEIITSFPQIDAVIRGDAEVPLIALMEARTRKRRYEEVPNLTWRDKGEVKENPLSYVASEKDLERASYANLALLRDQERETYVRSIGFPFVWAKGLSPKTNRKRFHCGPPVFPLTIGRGCTGNCTWCGGGAVAQRLVNGRRGVVFRAPERVVETMAEAKAWGYEMVHIAFDPGKEGERYYRQLFPLLRKHGLRMKCYFESFSLPSVHFLNEFHRTFDGDGSVIALSPECGDEKVRHRNKTFAFSNEELLKTISLAEDRGIQVDIFFAMGIPGERYGDLVQTAALRREIQRRFKNIGRVWTSPIAVEPASPWHLHPEEFGISSTRNTFADFYQANAPGGGGLGYYIPQYLGNGRALSGMEFEQLLRKAKCRQHCSLHPDPAKASSPFLGRLYCRYMSWRLRGNHG